MENNYNFDSNPQEVDASDIQKHQNFDKLMQQFQQDPNPNPAPKKPFLKIISVGAAAIAAAMFGFFVFNPTQKTAHNDSETPLTVAKVVAAPIKDLEKKFTTYEIDASTGGVIKHTTGSELTIPANAFVRPDGTPATGKVNVRYREFHDAVDIFLSGIPMNYDSSGVKYQLESAGMMEVYANQAGEELSLAKDKSLDMALKNDIKKEKNQAYNIYELDPKSKRWIFRTSDRVERLSNSKYTEAAQTDAVTTESNSIEIENTKKMRTLVAESDAAESDLKHLRLEAPAMPQKTTSSDYVFDINFNGLQYRGVAGNQTTLRNMKENQSDINDLKRKLYQGAMWKLVQSGSKLPSNYSTTQWDDIEVVDKGKNIFTLSLKKDDKVIAMDVTPVLVGKNYDKAMAEYNQRFAAFQANVAEKEAKLNDLKQNFATEKAKERELSKKTSDEKVAAFRANGQADLASEEILKEQVVNHFKVTSMGMWNCDRPLEPDFLMVNSNFKAENGDALDNQMAFMVSKKLNTVSGFYASRNKPLYFNPAMNYTLWMVTADNKLAIYTPKQFEDMKKMNISPNQSFDFVMTKIDKELKSEADVRAILNL